MPELIVQTRIISKKAPENIISRLRLLEKLRAGKSKNLIVVESPAGYGKTTLIQDFLAKSGLDHAWYHVTEDVNSFYSFFSYVVHSLKIHDKDFGTNTLELIESLKQTMQFAKDQQTTIPAVTGTFINEYLKHFTRDTYIVLDDLHKIGDPQWLKIMFDNLAEDCPENLHIIITTRIAPKFDLSKFTAKRNLVLLDSKSLRFDNTEIAELLEKVYSIKYNENDVMLLEKKIGGWITGIHLVLQASGADFRELNIERGSLPENIFDFFANDIYDKLDDGTKSFLIDTSLLENFTPDVCDRLLKINNSNEIISSLLRKNIFIETTEYETPESEKEEMTYSYNGLFKHFLTEKMREIKSADEIQNLVRTIYEFFKNEGDTITAIRYSLLCGDFDSAVPLIKEQFQALFDDVRFYTLWEWISLLPSDYVIKDGALLFYKGKLYKYLNGDMTSALEHFQNSLNTGGAGMGEDLLTECNIELSDTLLLMGKPEEALSSLGNMVNLVIEPKNKSRIQYCIASVNYRFGPQRYDEVINNLNECLEICTVNDIRNVQTDAFNLLGNVYQARGEFVKALFYYESVLKNVSNVFKKFLALSNIIPLYSSSGNYQAAKDYLDEANRLYKRFPSVLLKRNLLRKTAFFCFEIGDYEQSIELYNELIVIEEKSNLRSYIFWYYILIGEAHIFLNKNQKAAQFFELASKYMDTKDKFEKTEYEYHLVLLKKRIKPEPSLEKELLRTLKFYESSGHVYTKAQIEFHLADFYFITGSYSSALKYLLSSLSVSSEKQYISFLEQNFLAYRYLFDFALLNGIEKDFIGGIRSSVLEKLQFDWLSEKCKTRAGNEIESIYDIKLTSLGRNEILVRGKLVTEDKWIRKKSKLILVYLLLNAETKFTKDKMMDMFFQDLSIESADNIFHQAVTNIRNAVKPSSPERISLSSPSRKTKIQSSKVKITGEVKAIEPSFIIYEDKILQLSRDYYYKVDIIDFNKLYNKVKSAGADSDTREKSAKNALELYKGEFLPGYYDSWCEDLRESLSTRFTDLCDELIDIYKQKNMPFELTVYAEKLLEVDKLNEKTYIDLIEAYGKLGNINSAKNKFSLMLKIFDEEYGEKPSSAALERIKNILMQN